MIPEPSPAFNEDGTKYELSQSFQDYPDFNPVKVEVMLLEYDNSSRGILISQYIGAKVFLTSCTSIFQFAPTKVKLFIALPTSKNEKKKSLKVFEIPIKGASEKRMLDYGIFADKSQLFISQFQDVSGCATYNLARKSIMESMGAKNCVLESEDG